MKNETKNRSSLSWICWGLFLFSWLSLTSASANPIDDILIKKDGDSLEASEFNTILGLLRGWFSQDEEFSQDKKWGLGLGDAVPPDEKLHVGGDIKADHFIGSGDKLTDLPWIKSDKYSDNIYLRNSDNGQVGIGYSPDVSLSAALDVAGNINFTGDLLKNGTVLDLSGSGSGWTESNGNVVRESGNVGIGESIPTKKLDVAGDINFTGDLYKSGEVLDLSGTGSGTGSGDITLIGSSLVAAHAGPGGNGTKEGTESDRNNNFLGNSAGQFNTTGRYNNFLGLNAGLSNTEGEYNNFLGLNAGSSNTTGKYNNFLGNFTGNSNTTGNYNNFLGNSAGRKNTIGKYNNFLGNSAGRKNTTGNYNNFLGNSAGLDNTTGEYNISIGEYSGAGTADHDKEGNFVTNNSVFLGSYARPKASDETNQIVIGYDAIGAGSNTATIGNDKITKTVLQGNVGIGTNAPVANLDITSDDRTLFRLGNANRNLLFVSDNDKLLRNEIYFVRENSPTWSLRSDHPDSPGGEDSFAILSFVDSTREVLSINGPTGNVGIGNSTPTKALDVTGDINFTGDLYSSGVLVDLSGSGGSGGDITLIGNSLVAAHAGPGGNGTSEGTEGSDLNNNFLGSAAGSSNTTGNNNNFLGHWAGYLNKAGDHNNFLGADAGYLNATGVNNNFIGSSAGVSNTTGNNNNFFGLYAGSENKTGSDNVGIGQQAGASTGADAILGNITTNNSVFLGSYARPKASDETNQIVIGYRAIGAGSDTVTIGNTDITKTVLQGDIHLTGDLYQNGTALDLSGSGGGDITLIGNSLVAAHAGPGGNGSSEGTETDRNNNFLGDEAGLSNTTGNNNNFLGESAGKGNTEGYNNNFIGPYAGSKNQTGHDNNFIGSYAGSENQTGQNNNFFGYYAGSKNRNGSDNVGIGRHSGAGTATDRSSGNQITNNSVFLGTYARPNANDETNQIVIGYDAIGAGSNTATIGNTDITKTVLQGNVGIGNTTPTKALDVTGDINFTGDLYQNGTALDLSADITLIGTSLVAAHAGPGGDGSSEGTESDLNNNFLGSGAGSSNTTGTHNNFLGSSAGFSNTTGTNNNFLGDMAGSNTTTGSHNSFIGSLAGHSHTTGNNNIGIGHYSGSGIASDQSTGNQITNNSVFLGTYARPNANDETNQIVIGYDAIGAGSNTATIGNDKITKTVLQGDIHLTGDIYKNGSKQSTVASPPVCSGTDKALGWDGSKWVCTQF